MSKKEAGIRKVVDNKILSALMNNEEEVVLKKSDFINIIKEYPQSRYSKSFDINFFIAKLEDNYNIVVGPNMGSSKAGSMFQRFTRKSFTRI